MTSPSFVTNDFNSATRYSVRLEQIEGVLGPVKTENSCNSRHLFLDPEPLAGQAALASPALHD